MGSPRLAGEAWLVASLFLLLGLNACALSARPGMHGAEGLRETAGLIQEVKAFGRTLGIQPTNALNHTAGEKEALSMLWLWLQKAGTLALDKAVDIRLAVGLSSIKERTKIEQVYRVEGYSVYYRQGNEFADPRSAVTPSFAAEGMARRVQVILHEDLHGDTNFALPWDIEESFVTPLAALATLEYFKYKGDAENLKQAQSAVNEGRQISRELLMLVTDAETIFQNAPVDDAKQKVLAVMAEYPAYQSMFHRQIAGQHAATVLEAKLSHDLAYFRYFDRIASLAERPVALDVLMAELKKVATDTTPDVTDRFLGALESKYPATPR